MSSLTNTRTRVDAFGRLLNETKSFEGGGLLPQPLRGQRIPTVNNLEVVRNKGVVGGAQVTVRWLGENLGVKDKVEVQVWASSDFGNFILNDTITDIDFSTFVRYSAPIIADQSPCELFIPATQRMVAVITAATVHSSGVVSLKDFQSSAAIIVSPLGSTIYNKSASFTALTIPATYLISSSGGAVTATLPPVKSFPDGTILNFKKISTDANNITIVGSENIDNFASFISSAPYISYTIISDRMNNQWWRIY